MSQEGTKIMGYHANDHFCTVRNCPICAERQLVEVDVLTSEERAEVNARKQAEREQHQAWLASAEGQAAKKRVQESRNAPPRPKH
jgi:hypothetical protein